MAPVVPMAHPIAYQTMKDAVRAGYDYIVHNFGQYAKTHEYAFIVIGQTQGSKYYHTMPQTDDELGTNKVQISKKYFTVIVAYCHTHPPIHKI
jgi:hypothetical protein